MDLSSIHTHMENFYFCSHLPIRAFNNEGTELLSTGFSATFLTLHQSVAKDLKDAPIHLSERSPINFTPIDEVHFTLCLIDTANKAKGFYLIGPYTSSLKLKEQFQFKPSQCMPHLLQLLYALDDTSPTLPPAPSEVVNEDYSYHIAKAETYIHAHYDEPITLEALSVHLGLNKSYLCTIFKKATKDSFCNYTNKVRIEESKKLLKTTNDSILDIALTVGFSSASYFNTTFKKFEGITPLDYRKNA